MSSEKYDEIRDIYPPVASYLPSNKEKLISASAIERLISKKKITLEEATVFTVNELKRLMMLDSLILADTLTVNEVKDLSNDDADFLFHARALMLADLKSAKELLSLPLTERNNIAKRIKQASVEYSKSFFSENRPKFDIREFFKEMVDEKKPLKSSKKLLIDTATTCKTPSRP